MKIGVRVSEVGRIVLLCALLHPQVSLRAQQHVSRDTPSNVTIKVVSPVDTAPFAPSLRQILVSRTINPPDSFPGWTGSVAWNGITRLPNGTLLVAFNAGYWHASPPTPFNVADSTVREYAGMGMPVDINAPTGGRVMIIRSTDAGRTWSKPATLADTRADDRGAALLTLPDGTVLCSWFTYYGDPTDSTFAWHVLLARSTDGGLTWSAPQSVPSPFTHDATDGPMTLLPDGSVLITEYGYPPDERGPARKTALAVLQSRDAGRTWTTLSTIRTDHSIDESSTAVLPDGRWVIVARGRADIVWSSDHGAHWTLPADLGMPVIAPGLYVLPDSTLVLLHGNQGLRVIFSRDGGHTWIAPAADHGFTVDAEAYGYGAATVLPDGTLYVVYQRTGSHYPDQVADQALLAIRVRIRPDYSGIDLLPPIANH